MGRFGSQHQFRQGVLAGSGNRQSTAARPPVESLSVLLADGEITFQAVLYGDGRIQVNYLDLAGNDSQQDEGQSATLGIKSVGETGAQRLVVYRRTTVRDFM